MQTGDMPINDTQTAAELSLLSTALAYMAITLMPTQDRARLEKLKVIGP